jgi:hypothetical protein
MAMQTTKLGMARQRTGRTRGRGWPPGRGRRRTWEGGLLGHCAMDTEVGRSRMERRLRGWTTGTLEFLALGA